MNKKHLLKGLLVAGCIVALPSLAGAAVCSDCHTMHASFDGASATPNDHLLDKNGCSGCHADPTAQNSAADFNNGVAPQINVPMGNNLAGGTFDSTAASRHDVTDLFGTVSNLTSAPGGGATAFLQANLSCSACHANQGHHSNGGSSWQNQTNGTLNGTLTGAGAGYRFLAAGGNDVYGIEAYDWELNPDATTTDGHNTYYGADVASTGSDANTMSAFCASCHTDFHGLGLNSNANTDGVLNSGSGAWIRHPTDLAFSSANQSGLYTGYRYDANVPVAVNNLALPLDDQDATAGQRGIVMCLSCHRAHGSGNSDMLRWDYTLMEAGQGSTGIGCFACHADK